MGGDIVMRYYWRVIIHVIDPTQVERGQSLAIIETDTSKNCTLTVANSTDAL